MKFEEIVKRLGDFGTYQKRLYFLLCIPAISIGTYMMMIIVVTETPDHRCRIPDYSNDTFAIKGNYHQDLINMTIPTSEDPTKQYDQCHVYTYSNVTTYDNYTYRNRSVRGCSEWVYDHTTFTETFATKMNLVCDDALKTSHAQMVYYFGVLSGDIIIGQIADWLGRKIGLYISLILWIAAAFSVPWAPNYISFVILHFIIGGTAHASFLVISVIGLELVGPTKRAFTGLTVHIFFAIGLIYVSGIGYFVKQWQYIELAAAIPCVFYLVYWWLIPESPRWLISKGRRQEANVIIQKAAKVNGVVIPEDVIDSITTDKTPKGGVWHLFTNKILFIRTMILFWNWLIVSLIYYGVTMNAGNIGGNFFLNFFLFACTEFPALAIAILVSHRIGRRTLYCASMTIGGVACLCTIFSVLYGGESLYPLTLTLALIGKLGAAAAFGLIYVLSAEIFPTVVRNSAMGACSCVSRIGGMLAPYVAKLGLFVDGKFGKALPLVIFGVLSISAGCASLFLPETLNQKLPDTLEDGINLGRKKKNQRNLELNITGEQDESLL